jgi:hypothetical protein
MVSVGIDLLPLYISEIGGVKFLQFCTCMCPVLVSLFTYGMLSSATSVFLGVTFVYAMFTHRFMVYLSILLNRWSFLPPCVFLAFHSRIIVAFLFVAIFPH